jgi:hypothetical protein
MKTTTLIQFLCGAALVLAAPLPAAAQDYFTGRGADGMSGNDWMARYDAFTVEDMHRVLSGYTNTVELTKQKFLVN